MFHICSIHKVQTELNVSTGNASQLYLGSAEFKFWPDRPGGFVVFHEHISN
jgi:hypothetical protein